MKSSFDGIRDLIGNRRTRIEIIFDILSDCQTFPGYPVTRLMRQTGLSWTSLIEIVNELVSREILESHVLDHSYCDLSRETLYYLTTQKGRDINRHWSAIKKLLS